MTTITQQKTAALKVVQHLQDSGHTALFAGGCVRDQLLGREPKDYDVATDARPQQVEKLFRHTLAIGKAFGVMAVIDDKIVTEVATFRKDSGASDGRHPESVEFCDEHEDALRRDFTINGMFENPVTNEILDFVGGQEDLASGIVRAIGTPEERFQEDHLRMLRAIRFASTLDFELEEKTDRSIRRMAGLITHISAERIEAELSRTLTESANPGDALRQLHDTGLLEHILPEALPMIGQEQPPQFHPEGDVFEHTVLMLNLMTECAKPEVYTPRELAYTVLLHDIGKPPTAAFGPGADGIPRIRFDGHAAVSAAMAAEILTRLKFPNKEKKHIIEAIGGHMRFMDVQQMRPAKLRRMIGAETFELEMALHRLDCLGSHRMLENYDFMNSYREEMANEPILPEPWVRGHDLIALGHTEGKRIGKILKEAYEAQMDGRFANRDELLEWIRSTYGPQSSS